MIKVKDVKYGIMPYSAGIGQSAIGIYFEDDDRTFDFEGLDEAKDEAVFRDAYTNIAQEMYKDIKDFVAKNNITEQWNAGLSFEKGIYTVFIGDVCVNDDYFYPFNMLLSLISKESIDRQQMSDAFAKARAEKRMPRLNPPRFMMVARPTNPMIMRNPYEACNVVIAKLSTKKNGKEISESSLNEFYHINSIMNIGKHPFGTYVFSPESEKDLRLFDQFYADLPFEHKLQVYVVPKTKTMTFKDTCCKWALDHDFRPGTIFESSMVLDFDD